MDVTWWLRSEAHASPQRVLCHTHGRGKDSHLVPGWPYSLGHRTGDRPRTVDRPVGHPPVGGPGDDATTVTAGQLREVVQQLSALAGAAPRADRICSSPHRDYVVDPTDSLSRSSDPMPSCCSL